MTDYPEPVTLRAEHLQKKFHELMHENYGSPMDFEEYQERITALLLAEIATLQLEIERMKNAKP